MPEVSKPFLTFSKNSGSIQAPAKSLRPSSLQVPMMISTLELNSMMMMMVMIMMMTMIMMIMTKTNYE